MMRARASSFSSVSNIATIVGSCAVVAFAAAGCSSTTPGGGPLPFNDAGADAPFPEAGTPFDAAVNPPGSTGTACTAATDCKGTGAKCTTTSSDGVVYPGGYCTSTCDVSKNNQGINSDCPGFGVCIGAPTPSCFSVCSDKAGTLPCRDGYLCFGFAAGTACLPAGESRCDPTKKGTCPKTDAGGALTCVQVGPDPVGSCFDGCDVFAQTCAAGASGPRGCFSNVNGEGFCTTPNASGTDGVECAFIEDCAAGFGCHGEKNDAGAQTGFCRPYCGGPQNKGCTNGKSCIALFANVATSTVGVCGN